MLRCEQTWSLKLCYDVVLDRGAKTKKTELEIERGNQGAKNDRTDCFEDACQPCSHQIQDSLRFCFEEDDRLIHLYLLGCVRISTIAIPRTSSQSPLVGALCHKNGDSAKLAEPPTQVPYSS
jgi:hypothetical protein